MEQQTNPSTVSRSQITLILLALVAFAVALSIFAWFQAHWIVATVLAVVVVGGAATGIAYGVKPGLFTTTTADSPVIIHIASPSSSSSSTGLQRLSSTGIFSSSSSSSTGPNNNTTLSSSTGISVSSTAMPSSTATQASSTATIGLSSSSLGDGCGLGVTYFVL